MLASSSGARPVRTTPHARGLTIIEVTAAIGILIIIVAVLLPTLGGTRRRSPQIKCSTQVRITIQAMQIWANSNRDQYPLPSALDVNNLTTSEAGVAKDHLANVLSILIYNASISPEICISPSEVSGNIETKADYQNSAPSAAVDPKNALWDPSFKTDFTGKARANNSYAALQLSTARLPRWGNTFSSTEAVFGNRGPRINSITRDAKGRAIVDADQKSLTHQIHGNRKTWEGNIGYNDGHVNLESTLDADESRLPGTGKPGLTDVFHADDPEDTSHTNTWLGIFTTGGDLPTQGTPIWD